MAAVLAVTEPCSTGLGGDAFALYYDPVAKKVKGLNGSGRSAQRISLDLVLRTFASMPSRHGFAVTVPGTCAAWLDLLSEWGTMSPAQVLRPAIDLAKNGFAVGPVTAHQWGENQRQLEGPCPFLPAPKCGDVFRNPILAATLEDIVTMGKAAIYDGRRARAICDEVQRRGGVLDLDDLKAHTSEFVKPIKLRYRNQIDVFEHPPNGQGVAALMALDAFQSYPLPAKRFATDHVHLAVECMRSAFVDARMFVADPATMTRTAEDLIHNPELKRQRLARIDAAKSSAGKPLASSDTVSFSIVDSYGGAISMVNSNYTGFGTGFCPEHCGFTLQNRGNNFVLDPSHANCLAGNKRPYHTILPGMSLYADDGSLHSAFNVMGGFMQPQGHLQVISNLIDWGDDPQQALDAPRFCIDANGSVHLEPGMPLEGLAGLGHDCKLLNGWERSVFGRGQIILRQRNGVLIMGSDGRADGCAMGL